MTLWVVFGVAGAGVAGSVGWVAWRDRERESSAEDGRAARVALNRQHRYEAGRHASQGDFVQGDKCD